MPEKSLKEQFDELADKWVSETAFLSFCPTENPDYQKFLNFGKEIIPFIFERWEKSIGGFWECLLPALLGECPITLKEKECGRMKIIKMKWFKWAEENSLWQKHKNLT